MVFWVVARAFCMLLWFSGWLLGCFRCCWDVQWLLGHCYGIVDGC